MIKPIIRDKGTFNEFELKGQEGEPIENKVRRILDENEPLTDGAPIIYTDKKDGVKPEFNIRTDKWQVAIDAMDKVNGYALSDYLKTGENPEPPVKEADKTKTEPTGNTEETA